jgi:succinylarginine dihydrolase
MAKKYKVSEEEVASVLAEIEASNTKSVADSASSAKIGVNDFVKAYQKNRQLLVMAAGAFAFFRPQVSNFIAQVIAFLDKVTATPPPAEGV